MATQELKKESQQALVIKKINDLNMIHSIDLARLVTSAVSFVEHNGLVFLRGLSKFQRDFIVDTILPVLEDSILTQLTKEKNEQQAAQIKEQYQNKVCVIKNEELFDEKRFQLQEVDKTLTYGRKKHVVVESKELTYSTVQLPTYFLVIKVNRNSLP